MASEAKTRPPPKLSYDQATVFAESIGCGPTAASYMGGLGHSVLEKIAAQEAERAAIIAKAGDDYEKRMKALTPEQQLDAFIADDDLVGGLVLLRTHCRRGFLCGCALCTKLANASRAQTHWTGPEYYPTVTTPWNGDNPEARLKNEPVDYRYPFGLTADELKLAFDTLSPDVTYGRQRMATEVAKDAQGRALVGPFIVQSQQANHEFRKRHGPGFAIGTTKEPRVVECAIDLHLQGIAKAKKTLAAAMLASTPAAAVAQSQ